MQTGARVGVLLPMIFRTPFDYRVPVGMALAPGDYVRVPFGRKSVYGVVWGEGDGKSDESRLKTVEALCAHLPPMSQTMRDFLAWVSWYTLAPLGMVLKMALSAPEALASPKEEERWQVASGQWQGKLTPSRLRIVSYLSDGTARTAKEITQHAKVSAHVLREFIHAGGLSSATNHLPLPLSPATCHLSLATPSLSPDQQLAADRLRAKLDQGYSTTVLDGVTGSGKTEVYFDTIAACLQSGKQALVLLPEIGLSVQFLTRFEQRFGFAPDLWNSEVTPAKKRDLWRRVASSEARVVVGARSALFLPFAQLGLIVVDEEHDSSYKQEEGVIYHARDMAVARASREKIPILLVSATPSLETEFNLEHGRYARLHLMSRHGGAQMPTIRLIDMRGEQLPTGSWLCPSLGRALAQTFAAKRQSMLFMNRRGYAPLLLCRACGHRFQCPHCTSCLVLHRARGQLLCHHCGHTARVPIACPDCKKENTLIPYGPGVERIAEEARALLPEARIGVLTSDLVQMDGELAPTPEQLIRAMTHGEIDLLIGTQMIAKGHHFASLALVGVIDADMGLAGGDLRASERTFQLLHQLSGRAGREKTPGEVWLQTYLPHHPVMQALLRAERDPFMAMEAVMRADAGFPPYGKLAAVIIEGPDDAAAAGFARLLVRGQGSGGRDIIPDPQSLPPQPLILGPVPAPMARLRGKFRYRILIKSARNFPLQSYLSDWLLAAKIPSGLRMKIDIDPYGFL